MYIYKYTYYKYIILIQIDPVYAKNMQTCKPVCTFKPPDVEGCLPWTPFIHKLYQDFAGSSVLQICQSHWES